MSKVTLYGYVRIIIHSPIDIAMEAGLFQNQHTQIRSYTVMVLFRACLIVYHLALAMTQKNC